jgi:SCP-2 sterol transfer family protein
VLTEAGGDLKPVIDSLGAWGARWAFGEPKVKELDPALLLWKIHQRIRRDALPSARTVVEFDLSGPRGRRLWLVMQPHDVSVCLKPPGYDAQVVVRTEVKVLYRVWLGEMEYAAAVRGGSLVVEGPRPLVQALPRWFLWSPMARFVRAGITDRRTAAP